MRGPNEARLEREQRSRAARKLRSLGCRRGICSSPFVGPGRDSIQTFRSKLGRQVWSSAVTSDDDLQQRRTDPGAGQPGACHPAGHAAPGGGWLQRGFRGHRQQQDSGERRSPVAEDGCGDGKLDAVSGGESREFGLDRSGRGRSATDRRRAGSTGVGASLAPGRHGDEPRAARPTRSACGPRLARKLKLSLRSREGFVAQGAATYFCCGPWGLFLVFRVPHPSRPGASKNSRVTRRREGWVGCRSVWVMPRALPRKRAKDETLSFRGARLVGDEAGTPTGAAFAPVGVQARNLLLVLVAPRRFANPSASRQTG